MTAYKLHFVVDATGVERVMYFETALERAIFIVSWSSHITVLGGT